MIRKFKLFFFAVMLIPVFIMIVTSCRKEFIIGDPPKLPPIETFLMNYSGFSNPDDTLQSQFITDSLGKTPTFNNWRHAYNTVNAWDSIADFSIAIVTTCYNEALKNAPIHLGGHTFGWPCSFIYLNSGYSASLIVNWVTGEEFKIEMYISKPGMYGFNSFKWMEGVVRYDWTSANWTLYGNPNNTARVFRIEWNKNWNDNKGDIKYTYMRREHFPSGSYIQFKLNPENVFDASYVVYVYPKRIFIEWNMKNKLGRIIDPLKYNDNGAYHCWSPFLHDINCDNLIGES